jgi:hypothetical protein
MPQPPKPYVPRPLDTSAIKLSPALNAALESLARNIHELWAATRIADGWTYGPNRDDHLRTHPGLVPFDQLDESEKQYDRTIALETVKSLLALGFAIQEKEPLP